MYPLLDLLANVATTHQPPSHPHSHSHPITTTPSQSVSLSPPSTSLSASASASASASVSVSASAPSDSQPPFQRIPQKPHPQNNSNLNSSNSASHLQTPASVVSNLPATPLKSDTLVHNHFLPLPASAATAVVPNNDAQSSASHVTISKTAATPRAQRSATHSSSNPCPTAPALINNRNDAVSKLLNAGEMQVPSAPPSAHSVLKHPSQKCDTVLPHLHLSRSLPAVNVLPQNAPLDHPLLPIPQSSPSLRRSDKRRFHSPPRVPARPFRAPRRPSPPSLPPSPPVHHLSVSLSDAQQAPDSTELKKAMRYVFITFLLLVVILRVAPRTICLFVAVPPL